MRLALFDLDNTLIDRTAAFRSWCQAWAALQGLPSSAVDWMVEQERNGYRPRIELMTAAVEHWQLASSPALLVAAYRQELPRHVVPDDEVLIGLRHLRSKGWTVGIATNGSPSQRASIDAASLTAEVDGIAVSGEVGSRKPEAAFFRAAAKAAGASEATERWMVGDNPEADIVGGSDAGYNTIWVSTDDEWPLGNPFPTITVGAVRDAFAHLQER